MNIRVDLQKTIYDGTEVVFRSPVDCSQITGLIVYYKEDGITASKEFAFADAHGNNVGDIDHLFAENVVVKVILDLSTNMAFVQNADTNAYLEGRIDGVDLKLPQDMTPEQQAQARKNIGANSLVSKAPTDVLSAQYIAESYFAFFYTTLAGAVVDLNAGTLGDAADATADNAICALYTDFDGNACLTLFSNINLDASITFSESVIFRLNGYTVNYTGDYSIYLDGSSSTLDMRVPGSKLSKNVDTVSTKAAMVQSRNGYCKLLGGSIEYLTADATEPVFLAGFTAGEAIVEDCTFSVEVKSGSAQVIGIQTKAAVEIRNSTIQAKAASGTCNGIYCPAATPKFIADSCRITAESTDNACNAFSTAATAENAECTLYNCELTAISTGYDSVARGALLSGSAVTNIDSCKIKAASDTMASYAVSIGSDVTAYLQNSNIFADGTTGSTSDTGKVLSIGINNSGALSMEHCQVYGTHSGLQCSAGSTTWIDGGLYEGVGHGGVYLAHLGGKFFAQNADFKTANYRGQYKQQYGYTSTYRYAAVYIGGSEDASNIKAYFDNCIIDGGGPCPVPGDDGDDLGAEPIRFRGSLGEKNNTIYISNCTLMGDGKIRFGNTSHKLVLGFGNRLLCEASIPSCVDSTSCAGQIFTDYVEEE